MPKVRSAPPRRVMQDSLRSRLLPLWIAVLATVAFGSLVWAHQDPPGATGTGVNLSLTAFRSDGVTLVFPGTVNGCGETIIYRGTLAWAGGASAAIQGGTLSITTPDGAVNPATPVGGIPCLGGTDGVICTPGVTSINTIDVPFTVTQSPSCTPGTTLQSSITYANGIAHLGAVDAPGVGGMVPFSLPLQCCPTPTPTSTPTTPTPTFTPGEAPPDVPTLSFPMLALLGLMLAGAGLFFVRRQ